jgi:hypothetical protein
MGLNLILLEQGARELTEEEKISPEFKESVESAHRILDKNKCE